MLFSDYLNKLVQDEQYYFTIIEAQQQLGKAIGAIRSSISHCLQKNKLTKIVNGFYAINYNKQNSTNDIKPENFIVPLMRYLGCDYYVGLLTAAMYHGASHQAPQVFQVVVNKKRPAFLNCGKYKIQFLIKSDIGFTAIQKKLIQGDLINLSIPESTIIDLLLYAHSAGGLNHAATVISELKDSIDIITFKKVLETEKNLSCKQRLGYLLEILECDNLADIVYNNIEQYKRLPYIPLSPSSKISKENLINKKWHLIINYKIEGDI